MIVVLNQPYADPYAIGGRGVFLAAPTGSGLVGLRRHGPGRASAPIVHVLGCGIEATAGWTDAALAHSPIPRWRPLPPGGRSLRHAADPLGRPGIHGGRSDPPSGRGPAARAVLVPCTAIPFAAPSFWRPSIASRRWRAWPPLGGHRRPTAVAVDLALGLRHCRLPVRVRAGSALPWPPPRRLGRRQPMAEGRGRRTAFLALGRRGRLDPRAWPPMRECWRWNACNARCGRPRSAAWRAVSGAACGGAPPMRRRRRQSVRPRLPRAAAFGCRRRRKATALMAGWGGEQRFFREIGAGGLFGQRQSETQSPCSASTRCSCFSTWPSSLSSAACSTGSSSSSSRACSSGPAAPRRLPG